MAALHGVRFRCCEGRVFEVSSAIASGFLHEVRFRCCEGEGVGVAPDHECMHLQPNGTAASSSAMRNAFVAPHGEKTSGGRFPRLMT